ncbi:hypothetical protein [Streptomyces hesseae]|uniref:Uncharacterized protein n=1 Tax=Streptomyces hesseae TaxID=3075519 RepID=A0ABU2SGT9_9ACTN|nr:hypothetical protein [Streptomyces sp. DSM 40473]MDT0448008.1 hypothetical protein [Streptomyces sp. DSM 40473]
MSRSASRGVTAASVLSRRAVFAGAVALALWPATAVAAGPAAAPARTAQGGPVRITEGQVAEAARGQAILYPSVTSCLTVTVRLSGGAKVGAHASLFQVPGELRSDEILGAVRRRVAGRRVLAVEVRGAVGAWDPSYFTKAIESYGDGESVPFPTRPDPEGLARAVAGGLGLPASVRVGVEDVPDGDQTVR